MATLVVGMNQSLDGYVDHMDRLTELGLIDVYRIYLHPRCAGSEQALFRRTSAAAAPGGP